MRRIFSAALFILLFTLLFRPCAAPAADPLVNVLAPFSAEWALKEKPVLYDRDNLFDHINGEAEIYFPYGFELLASGTYASRKNPELWIVADIYRMGSALDAFGIYSNYRRPDSEFVKTGAEGFVSPSQMLFYQDRYFVRIQVTGDSEVDKKTLLDCGKAISGRLPAVSKMPPELEIFSVPEIVPKSERYIAKSLLGYDFFRRGLIADAKGGGGKFQVFVITEDSPGAASRAFESYAAYLRSEGKETRIGHSPGREVLESVDPLYGKVHVEQEGRRLLGAVRLRDYTAALPVLEKMRAKLEI